MTDCFGFAGPKPTGGLVFHRRFTAAQLSQFYIPLPAGFLNKIGNSVRITVSVATAANNTLALYFNRIGTSTSSGIQIFGFTNDVTGSAFVAQLTVTALDHRTVRVSGIASSGAVAFIGETITTVQLPTAFLMMKSTVGGLNNFSVELLPLERSVHTKINPQGGE